VAGGPGSSSGMCWRHREQPGEADVLRGAQPGSKNIRRVSDRNCSAVTSGWASLRGRRLLRRAPVRVGKEARMQRRPVVSRRVGGGTFGNP